MHFDLDVSGDLLEDFSQEDRGFNGCLAENAIDDLLPAIDSIREDKGDMVNVNLRVVMRSELAPISPNVVNYCCVPIIKEDDFSERDDVEKVVIVQPVVFVVVRVELIIGEQMPYVDKHDNREVVKKI